MSIFTIIQHHQTSGIKSADRLIARTRELKNEQQFKDLYGKNPNCI